MSMIFYGIGVSVSSSLMAGFVTAAGLLLLGYVVGMRDYKDSAEKARENIKKQLQDKIQELEQLKAERDKIPPEQQNFKNPVYSDLSIRIADIELEQRGVYLQPGYNSNIKLLYKNWIDDDLLVLMMTNKDWRDKFF